MTTSQQRHLDELWAQISTHKLPELYRRSHQLVGRNYISAVPDGYPAATIGPGGSSGSTSSPVESATFARERPNRDEVDRAAREVLAAFVMILDGINRADNAWRTVGHRSTGEQQGEPCESCKRAGLPSVSTRFGSVAGKLDRKWRLCDACRDFVKHYERVPTVDELRHHAHTGKWRVRVDPSPFRWSDGSTTGITPPPPSAA